jgi:hypothetical protein
MTYTINGKEYTEDEINNAITEIRIAKLDMDSGYNRFMAEAMRLQPLCYTRNPLETDAIIDECWDELIKVHVTNLCSYITWEDIIGSYKCTKLVAACICYVKINEGKL